MPRCRPAAPPRRWPVARRAPARPLSARGPSSAASRTGPPPRARRLRRARMAVSSLTDVVAGAFGLSRAARRRCGWHGRALPGRARQRRRHAPAGGAQAHSARARPRSRVSQAIRARGAPRLAAQPRQHRPRQRLPRSRRHLSPRDGVRRRLRPAPSARRRSAVAARGAAPRHRGPARPRLCASTDRQR